MFETGRPESKAAFSAACASAKRLPVRKELSFNVQ